MINTRACICLLLAAGNPGREARRRGGGKDRRDGAMAVCGQIGGQLQRREQAQAVCRRRYDRRPSGEHGTSTILKQSPVGRIISPGQCFVRPNCCRIYLRGDFDCGCGTIGRVRVALATCFVLKREKHERVPKQIQVSACLHLAVADVMGCNVVSLVDRWNIVARDLGSLMDEWLQGYPYIIVFCPTSLRAPQVSSLNIM